MIRLQFFCFQLKALTKDLLDSEWKLSRNKQLLAKMLELEEPSISPKVMRIPIRIVC